ncbi:outer membrane beta-barrel protein [Porphyromonas circumdentaria]|uniref:outer membrane beta-barrel protein n=1 Tax=Porphyromonas circumdentaria TaxID=29524 RepID=UPI00099A726D|nr:outer membrane beta-barrel protein [Porphyromonas circumdentaria]
MYVAPGLAYSVKGFKSSVLGTTTVRLSSRIHYLEVPINVGYRIDLGNKFNVSVEVGPYVAFGLFGSATRKVGSVKTSNSLFQEDGTISRFDMGVGASVALDYDRYYATFGYERGLLNMSTESSAVTLNNLNYIMGIGFRF